MITKRKYTISYGLAVLLLVFAHWTNAQQTEPPNILIFMADDAGMDFGAYGNTAVKTPNIDKLAQEGLRADNAFLTTPQCSPTRTSILAGQFAHTIGTEDLHAPLNDSTKLLPHYLQQKGYYTGLLMKTHIGGNGEKQFNTILKGLDEDAPELFRQFLDSAEGKPFFCWSAFFDPHRPYGDGWGGGAPEVHNPEEVIIPPYFVDDSATRKDIAMYYDEIHRMDNNIGTMLKELKKRGLRDNTLVIFLSDNGMPFPRGKGTLYDFGIKTPLIFHWDGKVTKAATYDELISVIDLAPTILEIVGIEKPTEMYGESIAEVFKDQTVKGRDYIFAERNWHDTDAHIRCVRSKDYKLILNGYPELPFPIIGDFYKAGAWWDLLRYKKLGKLNEAQNALFEFPRHAVELYHVVEDSLEIDNLVTNKQAVAKGYELLAHLNQWRKDTKDYPSHQRRRNDAVDRKSSFRFLRQKNGLYSDEEKAYWEDKPQKEE